MTVTTCKFCALAITSEPYGGNRDYAPEWHSDNDDADHSGFTCLSDESPDGQHAPSVADRHSVSIYPLLALRDAGRFTAHQVRHHADDQHTASHARHLAHEGFIHLNGGSL